MQTQRIGLLIAIGFALLLLQSIFSSAFAAHPWMPNLTLPIVVWVATSPQFRFLEAAIITFVVGYLADVFSGQSLGLNTLIAMVALVITASLNMQIRHRGPGFQTTIVFILGVFSVLFGYVLRAAAGPASANLVLSNLLYQAIACGATTALFGFAFFKLAERGIERVQTRGKPRLR